MGLPPTEAHDAARFIRFNRPEVRNALCLALISELRQAIDALERDGVIGAIVLTGNDEAFAAGADIKEMEAFHSFAEVYLQDFNAGDWLRVSTCRKPTIAAVAGYGFGGGCELALMYDFILAANTAKFG